MLDQRTSWAGFRRRRAWALAPFLAGAVMACPIPDATPPGPAESPPPELSQPAGCAESPRLSSELRQLLEAPDPAAFASERALHLADERVRVVIELLVPEGDLADAYGLIIEGRFRNVVQALAPLATLCALGGDERVRVIRAPTPASPS